MTEKRISRLCSLIAKGMSKAGACKACGIAEATFYKHLGENAEFSDRVTRAEGESEESLLQLALDGARKDGRIAILLLERRFKDWQKPEEKAEIRHLHAHATISPEMLAEIAELRRLRTVQTSAKILESPANIGDSTHCLTSTRQGEGNV